MAKSTEKLAARKMRRTGKSIKNIADLLGVSKSTASLWCEDIRLTSEQVERLKENQIKSGYKGRMMGAAMNRKKREDVVTLYRTNGRSETSRITRRELLTLGLGLYIGEGRKGGNRFNFSNSNPETVNIIIKWLRDIFSVRRGDMRCRIYINRIHAPRLTTVQREWARITGIPKEQFRKTVLINSKTVKRYENYESYLGTLSFWVTKSSRLQYRILGLIEGLVYNLNIGTSG